MNTHHYQLMVASYLVLQGSSPHVLSIAPPPPIALSQFRPSGRQIDLAAGLGLKSADLGLGPGSEDVVEENLAESEFTRVADWVEP